VSWLAVLLVVPLDLFATVVLATFAALLAFLVPAVVVRIVIHENRAAARRVAAVR
jgi:hypothetical protein